MRAITCDICGKEIATNKMDSYLDLPDSASTLRIRNRHSVDAGDGLMCDSPDMTYEICQYCTQRVVDYVKNLTKNERFGSENVSHGVSY